MKYDVAFFYKLIAANKLKSVGDFKQQFPAQYLWYCRHKRLIGPLPLSTKRRYTRTKQECADTSLKYKHKSDFKAGDNGAYSYAQKRGWLKEICAHMVPKENFKGGKPGFPAHNRLKLEGARFGSWTVLHKAGVGKQFGWACVCECGTQAEVSTANLTTGASSKCLKCSKQLSTPVKELSAFLTTLGINHIVGYKKLGFEIDIYVPEKRFFIEYDGLVWHSTKFRASASNELARYRKFKAAGLTGLRIFEDSYLKNPQLIKTMIAHRLGKGASTVPGNVELQIVQRPSQFKTFCDSYHLDGYGRSSWAVVATDGPNVLAFMGFRPYMSGKYKGQQELSRFCTNSNFNCYGLFGKMLKLAKKHIKQQNLAQFIVSASDNCISDGKVYKHNGFRLVEQREQLNWYYYLHSKGLRMHRARGKRLNPPKITQEEFALYSSERLQADSGFMASKLFGRWEPLLKVFGWGNKLWVTTV